MRPAEHYAFGNCVVIPAEACAYILRYSPLWDWAAQNRGKRPDVDAVIVAMGIKGREWANPVSDTGNMRAPIPEIDRPSEWLSTTQIASLLHMTSRNVIRLINEGRLPATNHGGRWWISRQAYTDYRRSK